MKPTFTRAATLDDAVTVAERLREEDRAEVLAACGVDPRYLLPMYVADGRGVRVSGIEGGPPEIVFGFDPVFYNKEIAVAWMLSTPAIYDHPVEFTVNARYHWNKAHERFHTLTNFIDERNTRHIQWLEWMGAKIIHRIERYGAGGLPFLLFKSYRPKCA